MKNTCLKLERKTWNLNTSWLLFSILITLNLPAGLYAQDTTKVVPDGTQGEFHPGLDSTLHVPEKKKVWNQIELRRTTMRFGIGVLYEYAAYAQDEESKFQSDSAGNVLEPKFKFRDFRLLLSGQFKTKRTITWKVGLLYDGPSDDWLVRESGIMVEIPEIWGHVFVGRTKEGFSLNKVMNGYAGWTMERQMAIDVIPILADGIKWLGYLPKQKLIWNLGVFTDWLSKGHTFSTYEWQVAARVAWLPIFSVAGKTVLHIGLSIRHGDPLDGNMRLRSRPEANPAPYFIDTGTFPADHSNHFGPEIYYSSGPFMVGSEYYWHKFKSSVSGDHLFNGGDVMASYILTGESRPYTTVGGIYTFVPVKRSVFKGGRGAIEALVRLSHLDLDDGNVRGGKFWRITPMLNWYLSSNLRLEFAYGYGVLDRYNTRGATQFFQGRIQFVIL